VTLKANKDVFQNVILRKCRVIPDELLGKLIVIQLVKKLPTFYLFHKRRNLTLT